MDLEPLGRRRFLAAALLVPPVAASGRSDAGPAPGPAPHGLADVREYGARGDGVTHDTGAIQAAVDAVHATGGGTVRFPAGRFLSGTVTLRSRVTLHLSAGSVLLGSPSIDHYPAHDFPARDLDVGGHQVWSLLYAEDAEQIAVEGDGVVDGQGEFFPKYEVSDPDVASRPRPRLLFFKNCRSVSLRDVTLREAGMWTVHLALCDVVRLRALRIVSSFHLNQDGIVLDSCRDAVVSDCSVRTVDDAIVLKSSFPRVCQDIAISNCVVESQCAGLKLGTQSLGGFRNIAISNCALHDCRLGGLKFQTVDGGDLENVTVSNIAMDDVAAPVSFRRGRRGFDFGFREVERPRPVGRLRGVSVRGLRATMSTVPGPRDGHTVSVAGIPGHPVEDLSLHDIEVVFPGGGTLDEARRSTIPEREAAYPEHTMFGVLPAYGLWLRHAARVALHDVRFLVAAADARPALMAEDVDELRIRGLVAQARGSDTLIRLRQVRGALLQACQPDGDVDTFVRAEGDRGGDIAMMGNDLRSVRRPVRRTERFRAAVATAGNVEP